MRQKNITPRCKPIVNAQSQRAARPVPDPTDLNHPSLYINRELSSLEYERRVLARAKDASLTLVERLRALTTFFHNLDEFFMVRIMNLEEEAQRGSKLTGPDGLKPLNVLASLHRQISSLQKEGESLWFVSLKPALEKAGIRFITYDALSERQRKLADRWFDREVFPLLTPQAVDAGRPMPMITGISVNFAVEVEIDRRKLPLARSYVSETDDPIVRRFARVKCPTALPRFLFIPAKPGKNDLLDITGQDGDILLLEDLIEARLESLFPGCRVLSKGLFRLTRNAEGEILEADAKDLMDAVRDYVDTRRWGSCVRLEFEYGMPTALQDFIRNSLGIRPSRVFRTRLPLSFKDFHQLTEYGLEPLTARPVKGRLQPGFDQDDDIFATIRSGDRLLRHPWDSFENVLNFLRAAARDPAVTGIKQTLYRASPNSPVIAALLEAHRRGKQVTAVVELKARFNESANISWAEKLEENGINVVYGFADRKIHAKTTLVIRSEPDGLRRYVHIGTGNYNGEAALAYSDLSLFTADTAIANDVQEFFNSLSGFGDVRHYGDLLVSPHILHPGLTTLIDEEIALHQRDGKGRIIIKCNQLIDPMIIRALYRASQAGVRVDCLVRGICCLRPGIPGISDNIRVRSLIGRIHEHARIYAFRHGGERRIYLGSADLMQGNITSRVEMLAPVKEARLVDEIWQDILKRQLSDTVSSWTLGPDGRYAKTQPAPGQKPADAQDARR